MKNWKKKLAGLIHIATTTTLIVIAMFFIVIIFHNLYLSIESYFANGKALDLVLEEIFIVMLFVELVVAIKIYFKRDYHFPMRFFLYIGITDIIRRIIIVSEEPEKILSYSFGLLVMISALALLETKNHYLRRKQKEIGEEHFEL